MDAHAIMIMATRPTPHAIAIVSIVRSCLSPDEALGDDATLVGAGVGEVAFTATDRVGARVVGDTVVGANDTGDKPAVGAIVTGENV